MVLDETSSNFNEGSALQCFRFNCTVFYVMCETLKWLPFCDLPVVKLFNCSLLNTAPLLCYSRDVDDVHDLMDDIQEQNELATEISDALSTPFGINQDIDDVRM